MKVDVTTFTDITCPLAKVAAFSADPDHAPLWYKNIKSIVWKGSKHLGPGGKMDFVANFLGRRLAYTYEIVEWVPSQKLVMRTADGPFPMETTYTWQALSPDVTRMTLRNAGHPTGFSAFTAPFMQWAMAKANKKDLAALKKLLENKS